MRNSQVNPRSPKLPKSLADKFKEQEEKYLHTPVNINPNFPKGPHSNVNRPPLFLVVENQGVLEIFGGQSKIHADIKLGGSSLPPMLRHETIPGGGALFSDGKTLWVWGGSMDFGYVSPTLMRRFEEVLRNHFQVERVIFDEMPPGRQPSQSN